MRRSEHQTTIRASRAVGALLAAALTIGSAAACSSPAAASEVRLEPAAVPGDDPFTESVQIGSVLTISPVALSAAADQRSALAVDGGLGVPVAAGSDPGLYGGVSDVRVCDPAQLVELLSAEAAKATAWSETLGIEPAEIGEFVETLTPVILTSDTVVTNHTFREGETVEVQSVLQAGTAVLVADVGVPRVKCNSGNPLTEPADGFDQATIDGERWDDFDAGEVIAVAPVDAIDVFTLRDVETGSTYPQPAGTRTGGVDDKALPTPDAASGTWVVALGRPADLSNPTDPDPIDPECLVAGLDGATLEIDGSTATLAMSGQEPKQATVNGGLPAVAPPGGVGVSVEGGGLAGGITLSLQLVGPDTMTGLADDRAGTNCMNRVELTRTGPADPGGDESPTTTEPTSPAVTADALKWFGPTTLPQPIASAPQGWAWTLPSGTSLVAATVVGETVVALVVDAAGVATVVGLNDGIESWRHQLPPRADGQSSYAAPAMIGLQDRVLVSFSQEPSDEGFEDLGLRALDAASGAMLWSQRFPFAAGATFLLGPDSIVLVVTALVDDAQTFALDSSDGRIVWDRISTGASGAVTAVRDDRVVMSDWRNEVTHVLDIRTGDLILRIGGQDSALSADLLLTVGGDFMCDPRCVLDGRDPDLGRAFWGPIPAPGRLAISPDDGSIVMIDNSAGRLTAIDVNGQQTWAVVTCIDASAVAVLDIGVLVQCPNGVALHDLETGAVVRQYPSDADVVDASESLAAGHIMYSVVGSELWATQLGDGTNSWEAAIPEGIRPNRLSDPFDPYPPMRVAAFDRHVLLGGTLTNGSAVLAVLTDVAFTPPPTEQPIVTQPAPTTTATAALTVCVRADIDFAALRSDPSLDGALLAEIPPGTCDVVVVDPVPVQGSGFGWIRVRWQGFDGWTAASNTA